jgi:LysM repeat protein
MSLLGRFSFQALAVAVLVAAGGCSPSEQSALDEEKEPHFSLGRSRVNAMDYAGAVEAFTEALEANPRSAAAHYQLACLFDGKVPDPAAAIYHYQEFLRLDPKADNADVIRQHIYSCKQQLAADVLPLPSAPAAQKQIEDLVEKTHKLQDEVEKWRAYYTAQQAAAQTNPAVAQNNFTPQPQNGGATPDDISTSSGGQISPVTPGKPARPAPPKFAKPRTHVVAKGETLAAIARNHGVSLGALQAANPGVNPRKLRAGQTVNLPP